MVLQDRRVHETTLTTSNITTVKDSKSVLIDKYLHDDDPSLTPPKARPESIMKHINFQARKSNE